ncbi:MAG: DUF4097 family beta strand repeat protein [Bacillaceae bacterium]|nr:DUF4097 family beta strand repeat protein [Bacillaceae bacterium]
MLKKAALYSTIVLIIGIIGFAVMISFNQGLTFSVTSIDEKETFNPEGDIDQLSIITDVTDLNIIPHSQSNIIVELKGKVSENNLNKLKISHEQNGSSFQLSIVRKEWFSFSFFNVINLDANVYVPDYMYSQLKAESATGDITFEKPVTSKSVYLKSNTGDIQFNDFQGEELNVFGNTGDLDLENIATETTVVQTNTGKVSLSSYSGEQLNIKTTTGDIVLDDIQAKVDVKSNTGNVELGMVTISDDLYVKTNTGKIKVLIQELTQPLNFDYQTNTGDILVDLADYHIKDDGDFTYREGNGPTIYAKSNTGDLVVREN